MSVKRGVAFNTAVNAAAMPVLAVGQLLLTMVLADGLTIAQFGTWSFLLGFTFTQGYAGMLDLGFGASAIRSLVRSEHGAEDEGTLADVAAAFRTIYIRISIAGAGALAVLAPLLLLVVDVDLGPAQVAVVVVCFVGMLLFDMVHASNLVFLESSSRFTTMRMLDIGALYLWLLIAAVAIANGAGVVQLAVLSLAQSIVVASVSSVAARQLHFGMGSDRRVKREEVIRSLWVMGRWIALQRVASVMNSQMDRTVLAVAIGVVAVGRYQIPYKVQAFAIMLLAIFPSAVMPYATKLHASGEREATESAFHLGTRWTVGLTLPVILAIIAMANPLVDAWVGSEYLSTVGSVRLFLLVPIIASFHSVGATMMLAHGRARAQFGLASAMVAVNLTVSIALVGPLGINGVILGTIVGTAVVFVPYLVIERELFDTSVVKWLLGVLAPSLFVAVWTVPAMWLGHEVWTRSGTNYVGLVMTGAIAVWGWLGFLVVPMSRRDARVLLGSARGGG